MLAERLMDVGVWLLAIAGIPQLKEIWINRHDLRGYSLSGNLMLVIGLLFVTVSFILLKMWVSVAAQVLPLAMWTMATYYTWKGKKNASSVDSV